jgi:uncharacterized membrane protein
MDPRALRRVLPEADKAVLEQAMPKHREEIRKRIADVREARQGVAEALRAEPFDRERLAAAFASVREKEAAVAAAAQVTLVDVAGQVSPEGRAKMAEQMLKRRPQRGRKDD